jgi:hypothetical protein
VFRADLPDEEDRRRGWMGGGSGMFDWDRLSLEEGGADYFPPSPGREPFRTFFKTAPQEALRLTQSICNHAMQAWIQLSLRAGRTPRAAVLKFPWGDQEFWGNGHVYVFYRGFRGPHVLDTALMALEEWAFSGLGTGRNADDVISELVKNNTCCAVLGIALEIAIKGGATTPTTLALLASSHLWLWDIERRKGDLVLVDRTRLGLASRTRPPAARCSRRFEQLTIELSGSKTFKHWQSCL